MPAFDLSELIKEDSILAGMDIPYRFGKSFPLSLTLNDGQWQQVDNGRVWTMTLESIGALSLNFIFDNFYLPEGATLEIINEDGTAFYGPVNADAIPKTGHFMTDLIPGQRVSLFLYEPYKVQGKSTLTISNVIHAYRGFDLKSFICYGIGSSSSCNVDVACHPEYEAESKALALVLLANGTEWCSGSLLMSTDYSFKPYFLTAFHCIDSNKSGYISDIEKEDAENWMFKFHFKKEECGDTTLAASITYNGAIFRAAWMNTDFALMEISHNLKTNLSLYWLGWDRSGNTPSNGACIHHPKGDLMKISIEDDAFSTDKWNGANSTNEYNHWKVNFDEGVREDVSSGSPLFDQSQRVVGQLHGGPTNDNACQQTVAKYGKFNLSWTGGGTNDTRLSNWLDSMSTNRTTINSSSSVIISGTNMLCSQGTYTISNMPSDSFVALNTNYSSTGLSIQVSPNLNITSYSNGSLTVQKVSDGRGYIKVYYKGSLISTKEMWVGGPIITDLFYDGNYIYSETDYMSQAVEDYYWIINGVTYHSIEGRKRLNLPYGTYNVEAYAYNSCGRGPSKYTQIEVGSGGYYSLGGVSSDHQVTIVPVDYSGAPQPLEVLQAENKANAKALTVPYTLQNAQSGEVSGRGEMPVGGGVLDFSRVRSGLYVLTLTPQGRKAETFKVSFK